MKTKSLIQYAVVLALATPVLLMAGPKEDLQVRQATAIVNRFKTMPEQEIPDHVLSHAKGLAIITVTKGGFMWSGKVGNGIVVARHGNTWSGPSFIGTGGVGFGAQIGGQVTEYIFVLNTPEAVKAFSTDANVQLGGALSVAAGPVGRSAEAGVTPTAAVYAYSRSQGLFAGASLEGTVIATRKKANERYYNRPLEASTILAGKVKVPASANALRSSL
ncbi:MAG: YSC84-related protein [Prosthecobacter sp.]|nr:YSC84-related protein [Prosthecobacter sp.]